MKKILFVCTGNTCRSPMAEGFLKAALQTGSITPHQYSAASAGVSAYEGDHPSRNAVQAMNDDWGIDINNHRAASLNSEIVDNSFLILAMTRSHKAAVLSTFPQAKHKVFTLREYISEKHLNKDLEQYNYALDITDPFGMPLQVYRQCAAEIKQAIDKLVEKL